MRRIRSSDARSLSSPMMAERARRRQRGAGRKRAFGAPWVAFLVFAQNVLVTVKKASARLTRCRHRDTPRFCCRCLSDSQCLSQSCSGWIVDQPASGHVRCTLVRRSDTPSSVYRTVLAQYGRQRHVVEAARAVVDKPYVDVGAWWEQHLAVSARGHRKLRVLDPPRLLLRLVVHVDPKPVSCCAGKEERGVAAVARVGLELRRPDLRSHRTRNATY